MQRLLPSELAWYATGRFYAAEDGSLADYGYFLHLPFPGCPLFDGPRGETTAYFTFAAKPFSDRPVANGGLSLAVDPVGEFSLYLQRRPAGNFDDPATFAQGDRIATFRRTSLVVDTTVAGGSAGTALLISNVFSARLIESRSFAFDGREYDLAHAVGHGITQFGIAATAPIAPPPRGYTSVVPFTGSAIALGA